MIKAPHSQEVLDAFAQEHFRALIKHMDISNRLNNLLAGEAASVFQYIQPLLKSIIIGRPDYLEGLIPDLLLKVTEVKAAYRMQHGKNEKETDKWFRKEIRKVFNYDYSTWGFTNVNNKQLAFRHLEKLDFFTCPYCNIQFNYSINKKRKARPHIDHFLNKARHPYFALSFFNLIPACYMCNSSLKGEKEFSITTHIHPFLERMEGFYRFRTDISSADFLVGKKDFKIKLQALPNTDQAQSARVKRNLKDFAIKQRYQYHRDYVGDIIKIAHIYNETTISNIVRNYEFANIKIIKDENEAKELLIGNYLKPESHHKRILSKLCADICSEFGISLM